MVIRGDGGDRSVRVSIFRRNEPAGAVRKLEGLAAWPGIQGSLMIVGPAWIKLSFEASGKWMVSHQRTAEGFAESILLSA